MTERVWPILPRVDALLLDADGESEAQHGRVVQPTNINHIYISLVQTLELFWNVLPFAYDWRLSIAKTSQRLAQVVQAQFHGEPFHMVCAFDGWPHRQSDAQGTSGNPTRRTVGNAGSAELWRRSGRSGTRIGSKSGRNLADCRRSGGARHGSRRDSFLAERLRASAQPVT